MAVAASILVSLLNPVVASVFAGVFLFLWWYGRASSHVALFALAYFSYAVAFLLQLSQHPFGEPGNPILSNVFVGIAFIALIHGMLRRRGGKAPFLILLALFACGFGTQIWFALVQPNMGGRIYAVNFTYGAMLLVAAVEMRTLPRKSRIDGVLYALVLTIGLYVFARTLLLSFIDGHISDRIHYVHSFTWLVSNFSAALSALLLALTLIGAVVADLMDDLRKESLTDPLSGLLNRRGFEQQAESAIAHSRNIGMPAALVLCDLDNFKALNDRFGHACGDRVIVAFAQCLDQATPAAHLAARIGGEEFAVLLTGADVRTGRLFAEAIRGACASIMVAGLHPWHHVTASFGVAEIQADEELSALMRRADIALYQAKADGRDTVHVADGPLPEHRAGFRQEDAVNRR